MKRLIGRPQEALLCAKAKRQQQSAQPERKSTTRFLSEFEGKRAEIGYELSEDYWHRGIMSEAVKAVLSIGFDQLGLVRIQAIVTEENIASKKLLSKFNFKEEGCLRQFECHSVTGECKDMLIYSLLHTEFPKNNI
ncbi:MULTISPECIES: GNAT family N-acetyltransferase [unclassified Lysinibacillus]|uniref:GNAT family N-acetyltransferase n=1 Tax=unclassified Lysinibacillus TaxID=2636778 RepID=UPI0038128693